jgi:small-conductance mechanosensitive channel
MAFAGPNYLGVLLAAAASFMLGWVWYGVLFKDQWMAALGKTPEECKDQSMPMTQMVITFIALLVMALMLAGVLGHLGAAKMTLGNGIITGVACWLGFVITTMAVNHGFQGVKRSLTWIDGGHWLAVLAIQGAILGLMGAS